MNGKISDNPIVRNKLYEQFNARICLLDIYLIYKQIEAGHYNNDMVTLLLPVKIDTKDTVDFLKKNYYDDLIFDLISHVRISEDLKDCLSVKLDKCIIDYFNIELSRPTEKKNTVVYCNEGLLINTTNIVADIIMYPISQFHTEIIKAANHFLQIIRMNEIMGTSLFLEAYSPSMFTQYAQYWVGECLGLIKDTSKLCVV